MTALHAYSLSGAHRWQRSSPWYKISDDKSAGEGKPPCFNRPAPVATRNGVVVLDCRDWKLVLNAYDSSGKPTATARPLPQDMKTQIGIVNLGKTASSVALGYRLESNLGANNPDRGLLVFDGNLKKIREHAVWGDRLCCSSDDSMYAPTARWGKDVKWARISPDGQLTLLPTDVSRYTWVVKPGIGGEMILWCGKSTNGELSDSVGVRRIWKPSMSDASTILEYEKDLVGEVVACPNSRYVVRVWPDHKQKFVCLSSKGKIIWEHGLTLSHYFWPPGPLCDPDGNVYVMDTVRGTGVEANDIVLRCLSPAGETSWELKVDETKDQPLFESYLSPSGSHLLLIRHWNRTANGSRSSGVKLIFAALNSKAPKEAQDRNK